jgi:hypothetical protein
MEGLQSAHSYDVSDVYPLERVAKKGGVGAGASCVYAHHRISFLHQMGDRAVNY